MYEGPNFLRRMCETCCACLLHNQWLAGPIGNRDPLHKSTRHPFHINSVFFYPYMFSRAASEFSTITWGSGKYERA
jgi:hypothetical protein